jgi:hypothetical protein
MKPILWYHPMSGRVRFEETKNWIPLYFEKEDPYSKYAHRLALMLECMLLNPTANYNESAALLDEYRAAVQRWHEGEEDYVSPLGKG